LSDPFWQLDKQLKIFADVMKVTKARAYGPNYPKISDADSNHDARIDHECKNKRTGSESANAKTKSQLQTVQWGGAAASSFLF
jgi:multiple sugar transport system substrate-binding protein